MTQGHPPLAPRGTIKKIIAAQQFFNTLRARVGDLSRRDDREFLPAALEIMETPPSPVRMALIVTLSAFAFCFLAWASFGRLDVVAIAQGKIQPAGRVKVVQSTEGGRVARIDAPNGAHVRAGDVLATLDQTQARADVDALEALRASLEAEILRRGFARALSVQAGAKESGPLPLIAWPDRIPAATRLREAQVLAADLAQLEAQIALLDAQIVSKQRERERLEAMGAMQADLVNTMEERVRMRETLALSGSGSRAALIEGRESLLAQRSTLASYQGQAKEAEASLAALARERAKLMQTFVSDNVQKQAEAERALDDAAQRLAKAHARLEATLLRAPADGIVQASGLYASGQVINAGQEIMRVVPADSALEVEAYLPNKDIGFVRVGDEAAVKVETFPFTRFGVLKGRVTQIARDAIPLPEAAQIEANPARGGEPGAPAGAQRVQNLVFAVVVTLESPELRGPAGRVRVAPGMAVTAEIRTGSRTILEYLLSPVLEATSQAMRER